MHCRTVASCAYPCPRLHARHVKWLLLACCGRGVLLRGGDVLCGDGALRVEHTVVSRTHGHPKRLDHVHPGARQKRPRPGPAGRTRCHRTKRRCEDHHGTSDTRDDSTPHTALPRHLREQRAVLRPDTKPRCKHCLCVLRPAWDRCCRYEQHAVDTVRYRCVGQLQKSDNGCCEEASVRRQDGRHRGVRHCHAYVAAACREHLRACSDLHALR